MVESYRHAATILASRTVHDQAFRWAARVHRLSHGAALNGPALDWVAGGGY